MRQANGGLMIGLMVMALAAVLPAGQAKDNQADVALQAAIKTETIDGDLRGAIEQYRRIAALPGAGRATVATALLRMGQCHEKLGFSDIQEARKAYEQVVREYGDQAAAAEARVKLAALGGAIKAPAEATLSVRRVWPHADVTGRVSADGRFLSFTDWSAGGNLAVRDLVTGQSRPLTHSTSGSFAEPSMPSPDGKLVAYAWNSAGARDLHVVGLDGSEPRVLCTAGNGFLHHVPIAWSPDSRYILTDFVKNDGSRDMMLVAFADGSAKLLKAIGRDRSPGGEFSPDGRTIAWTTKDGLSVCDLRSGKESLLFADRSNPQVLGWAPDGKHILFSSERAGSADAWLIAVADGKAHGEPVLVRKNWGNMPMGITRSGAFHYAVINNNWETSIAELDPAGGNVLSTRPAFRRGNTRAPSWSPDGNRLAAVDGRTPGQSVIVLSMETGEEREIRAGEWTIESGGIHWTRDGKAVLVPATGPGKGESLLRMDVQTGQAAPVMPIAALGGWLRFDLSPDGAMIYYGKPPVTPSADGGRIVRHDLRSGQETEIVRRPGLYAGVVSPDGRSLLLCLNPGKSWSMSIMPVDGGEPREIVRIETEKESPFYGTPSWTASGQEVLFLTRSPERGPSRPWRMWLVPAEGGERRPIGTISARQLQDVRLNPDGRRIVIGDIKVDLEVWVMENFLPPANNSVK